MPAHRHTPILTLGIFALAPALFGFCGAYVGAPGESLSNYASEVVMARVGNRTTLTLISDYQGNATNFALLLPVPAVLGPQDVRVVDPALLDWIDEYSTPREVEYSCDTLFSATEGWFGCGGALGAISGCKEAGYYEQGWYDSGVGIDAAWSAYGYDFVVLSAEESTGLLDWLDTNGYAVPVGGEAILQEYIDAGTHFLAARVSLDDAKREGDWLWPIQLSYDSEVFSLPIRIGTISSTGTQEVVIYALTDPDTEGAVGISNYPQLEMPTECMLPKGTALKDWYQGKLEQVHTRSGAGWVQEYSWALRPEVSGSYHCDPCTAEAVAPGGSFKPFGLNSESAHLTRLHLRYTSEQATGDVQLYISGITDGQDQLKMISYNPELESLFPYCDDGWAAEPGTCPKNPGRRSTGAAAPIFLLAAAFLRRRRRP